MMMTRAARGAAMALLAAGYLCAHPVRAQEEEPKTTPTEAPADAPTEEAKKAPSPWVLLPTFSNNPKLGTSVGALAAYLQKFDAQSQLSMFGASAQYTSTDSAVLSLFARTSFAGDHHRLSVGAIGGLIKNDYDDFLGTGQPLKSEDHIRAIFVRYLYRLQD